MLTRMQAQQQQQQEVLAALTEQLLLGRQQSGPGEARTLPVFPVPPAPLSVNHGQGHLPPPLAHTRCAQCEAGHVHICLHSPAPATRSEASAVAQRPTEPPPPPGPGQRFPPAPPAASRVGAWVAASEQSRRAPTPPMAAQDGAPSFYAGSVVSTAASRQGINRNFKKLKKCIASLESNETMGEKTISFKLKELSASADKVRSKPVSYTHLTLPTSELV